MSGCSYEDTCPNCGGNLQACSDDKPFTCITATCSDCGFYHTVKTNQMGLKELNEYREEFLELEPLKRRRTAKLDPELEWD